MNPINKPDSPETPKSDYNGSDYNHQNQNNQSDNNSSNRNPYSGNTNPKPKQGRSLFDILILFFLVTLGINLLFSVFFSRPETEIEYSQFISLVESGTVDTVELNQTRIEIKLKKDADANKVLSIIIPNYDPSKSSEAPSRRETNYINNVTKQSSYYTGYVTDPNIVDFLNKNDVNFYSPIIKNSPILSFIFSWIVPIVLMYFLYSFIFKKFAKSMGGGANGMMNVGKSKAREYNVEKDSKVRFSDVAGQDEAKESLKEIIDFLHDPKKYQEIGAKQPRGALLVGPPGTGKTLLARAVAGEAHVPFYSLSGSEFVEMFVGVGASRVRDLFAEAKKNEPSIIFIDEIDAIGKSRDNQMSSNDEREQTLNQLLAEMDGFAANSGVMVLAATNRPEVLDKALLRPGRFDRQIIVERPDLPGRRAILELHTKKIVIAPDVDLKEIALATSGATGADLANMINEGALRAVRLGRKSVMQEDLMEAVEVVIAGKEKKDRILNPMEKQMVSYHEVGHALVSALQKNSQPVQKITIVPRTMGSLGYTMNMPEEERYLLTKDELLAQIRTLTGGRAAEIVKFGQMTTGASNDFERATALARGMVTQYGMSDTFGAMVLESTESKYLDSRSAFTGSEKSHEDVDKEVVAILNKCQEDSIALLKENTDALGLIAEHLIEKENITGEEFMELLEKARVSRA